MHVFARDGTDTVSLDEPTGRCPVPTCAVESVTTL
jgi:hypothetical protein